MEKIVLKLGKYSAEKSSIFHAPQRSKWLKMLKNVPEMVQKFSVVLQIGTYVRLDENITIRKQSAEKSSIFHVPVSQGSWWGQMIVVKKRMNSPPMGGE